MDKSEPLQTIKPQLVRTNLNLYEVQLSVFFKVKFFGILSTIFLKYLG